MIVRAFRFVVRRGFRMALYASALILGGVLASRAIPETVAGSGVPATEEREIALVRQVVVSGSSNVVLSQGEVPRLSVTGDDNLLSLMETERRGEKLTLHTKSGYVLRPRTSMTYNLTLPQLEKLTISGVGNLTGEGQKVDALTITLSGAGKVNLKDVTGKALTLNLSGAGHATLSGKVEKLTIKLSGVGEIDAAGLQASTIDVHVSGAGHVSVWAVAELKAKISGAGGIKYKGSPRIDQKTSGAGSIKPIGG